MNDELDEKAVYQILREAFPARNDFAECNYKEELHELIRFSVATKSDFRALLDKHSKKILEIDASPMDEQHQIYYQDEYPNEPIAHRIAGNFWFAYPALLRLALELEFGDEYVKFANERDGI